MCGIAGVWGDATARQAAEALQRALVHRGPDASGSHADDVLRMAMHRLKFRGPDCPLPVRGAWGIAAYNGQVWGHVDAAGRYASVADELAAEVQAATTQPHADGMFAYAHYDTGTRRLRLATDAHFIKPLFLRRGERSVAFASEMAPLLAHGGPGRLDLDALAELFAYGWYLGDRSCVQGLSLVWRHDVEIGPKGIALQPKRARLAGAAEPPDSAALRAAVRASLARSLQGAGPLGLALSGGLDSSILAAELDATGVTELTCISVRTADGGDGIGSLRELGMPAGGAWERWRHVVVHVDDDDFLRAFEESVHRFGQPTTMSSLPLYQRLADAAAGAGVRALLLGEGVDEYFAGYASYAKVAALADPMDYYRHPARERLVATLFGAQRLARAQGRFRACHGGAADLRAAEVALRLTRLLLRSDVCLMSRSIEGRVPFLHDRLPALAQALPWHALAAAPGKTALRAAYAPLLGERATRGKVRFKSSDAMLLRCLERQRLAERIAARCARVFGPDAVRDALALLRSPDGFDADILCLLMSLTFLLEGGLLHDDVPDPTSARVVHA